MRRTLRSSERERPAASAPEATTIRRTATRPKEDHADSRRPLSDRGRRRIHQGSDQRVRCFEPPTPQLRAEAPPPPPPAFRLHPSAGRLPWSGYRHAEPERDLSDIARRLQHDHGATGPQLVWRHRAGRKEGQILAAARVCLSSTYSNPARVMGAPSALTNSSDARMLPRTASHARKSAVVSFHSGSGRFLAPFAARPSLFEIGYDRVDLLGQRKPLGALRFPADSKPTVSPVDIGDLENRRLRPPVAQAGKQEHNGPVAEAAFAITCGNRHPADGAHRVARRR